MIILTKRRKTNKLITNMLPVHVDLLKLWISIIFITENQNITTPNAS